MHNDMVGSRCNEKSQQGGIHEKVRMDRLSSLPDDVIHTILSLISLREAIRTCVLSSRWRLIWTSLPCLSFSSRDIMFPEFVSNVLYHRSNELQLSSLNLIPLGEDSHAYECVKRILDYASSHNVQQLTITTYNTAMRNCIGDALKAKPSWGLTKLHFDNLRLSDDNFTRIFSRCPNLNHLSLRRCMVRGGAGRDDVLNICHPRLSNLTIESAYTYSRLDSLKVVAPQLKNLTIKDGGVNQYLISAPGLTSLVIKGSLPMQLKATPGGGFPSLEKVNLCFYGPHLEDSSRELVCLVHQLHKVKFLTLNLEILEVLSSSMEPPISHQPSPPFSNLNILKFFTSYPATVYMEVQPVTEIKNYLQDSFPSAIVTMISSEEIRGMRNIVSARKLIAEVGVLLDECKDFGYTNTYAPIVIQWDINMQIHVSELEKSVVTKLQRIEGLLTGLPVSKRPALHAIFSSVCEEAHGVTKNILEYTNIQYNNKKKSRFNGQFHETLDAGSIQRILAWFELTKNGLNRTYDKL